LAMQRVYQQQQYHHQQQLMHSAFGTRPMLRAQSQSTTQLLAPQDAATMESTMESTMGTHQDGEMDEEEEAPLMAVCVEQVGGVEECAVPNMEHDEEEEDGVESVSQSSDDYDTHTNPRTTIDETSAHNTPRGIKAVDGATKQVHHERMGSMLLKGQLRAMGAIQEDEERGMDSDAEDSNEESNRLLTRCSKEDESHLVRRKGSQAIQLLSAQEETEEEAMFIEHGHNKSATSRSIIEDTYLKYLN